VARYHRILWSEGLFLAPHHFQQSALFQEDQWAERVALNSRYPWGIRSLEIDQELLASGTFRVLSFRGLFPSGLSVRFPEIDPAPSQIDLKEAFDLKADHLDIYLGLPLRRSGWPNCRLSADDSQDRAEVRYSANAVTVEDENTGRGERTIQRAELNLKLLLGTEPRENFETLPIARVEKKAAGGYRVHDSHMPPMLALEGSPHLRELNREILERLVTLSSSLASGFTEAGVDGRDITPANLRAFLLFAMINGAIPLLAHYRETPATHPEQLYLTLAGLVGQLATLHAGRLHPRDVPAYRHGDPGPVFGQLKRMILELIEAKEGQGYHVIPLAQAGEGRFQARIDRDSLLSPTAALFLSISSEEIGENEIHAEAPRIIVASPDRIEQKRSLSLRGLPLQLVTVPPPAIPRRRNTCYYQLDTRGRTSEAQKDWEAIVQGRGLAIDIPRDILNAQFELLGLEGS
jgi:type VI secretion system protein ImpJ